MSPQHKALFLDAKCGNFVVGKNDTPKPGAGELLVRIEAVGLNPVDSSIQKWGLFLETYPAIIGTDIAGIVEAVGTGVTTFAKGDRVFYQGGWANDRGGYQQYNLITAATVAKIPNHLSFEGAATIPVGLTAAFLGLYNTKPYGAGYAPPLEYSARGKYAGKPLLVVGGASTVGQFVIQLGRLSGFSPIIATASLKHNKYLKSLGATHIIDRNTPLSKLPSAIKAITPAPLEIAYDAVSTAETQKVAYDILVPKGQLVVVLNPEVTKVDGKEVIHVFAMPTLPHTREICVNMYGNLKEWLEEGVVKPHKVEILAGGLGSVAGGLERMANGQVSGTKLIARPQES